MKKDRIENIRQNIIKWALFNAIVAILPIAFPGLHAVLNNEELSVANCFACEDLFVVSICGISGILGELAVQNQRKQNDVVIFSLIGISVITLILNSFIYVDLLSVDKANTFDKVFVMSIVFYLWTVFVSIVSLVILGLRSNV